MFSDETVATLTDTIFSIIYSTYIIVVKAFASFSVPTDGVKSQAEAGLGAHGCNPSTLEH